MPLFRRRMRWRFTLEETGIPITVEGYVGGDQPEVHIGEVDITPDVSSADFNDFTPVLLDFDGIPRHTGERYRTLVLKLRVLDPVEEDVTGQPVRHER